MNKKRIMGITLIIGIALIGVAVYLYHQQDVSENKEKQTASNTTTEEEEWGSESVTFPLAVEEHEKTQSTTENKAATEKKTQEDSNTTEKKQNVNLPDNYEWDEKRWGEPPQIIYDFAENQEQFDFVVNEIDSILMGEDGFTTYMSNGKIHYDNEYENQLNKELKENISYLLNNTLFYEFTKYESDYWYIYYNQEEDKGKYMYAMIYNPKMTQQELDELEYIKVVDKWYFHAVWKF